MSSSRSTVRMLQRRILCLLLCVVSWNGPIPMLHIHEGYSDCSTLVEHLHRFHWGEESSVLPCAAHWHFACLNDLRGELAGEPGDNSQLTVSFWAAPDSSHSMSDSADRLVSVFAWDSERLDQNSYDQRVFRNAPRSMLSSLLCAAPLAVITGVCLT